MQQLERYQICVLITAVMMSVIPQKNVIDISMDKIPRLGVQKLVSQSGLGCDNVIVHEMGADGLRTRTDAQFPFDRLAVIRIHSQTSQHEN
jgi:hypothetical protein